jgi:hypothetical protein
MSKLAHIGPEPVVVLRNVLHQVRQSVGECIEPCAVLDTGETGLAGRVAPGRGPRSQRSALIQRPTQELRDIL